MQVYNHPNYSSVCLTVKGDYIVCNDNLLNKYISVLCIAKCVCIVVVQKLSRTSQFAMITSYTNIM